MPSLTEDSGLLDLILMNHLKDKPIAILGGGAQDDAKQQIVR